MRKSEGITFFILYMLSNDGNLFKISVSEIPVKQICINQGIGINVKSKVGHHGFLEH